MGGRGASNGSNVGHVTPQQKRLMDSLIRRNSDPKNAKYGYSAPKFTQNKDGSVTYEYQAKRIIEKVHDGKMVSTEKNDIYERTEHHSGKIMQDGLRKEGKNRYTDVLIKKGKR